MESKDRFFITKSGGNIAGAIVDYVVINENGEKVVLFEEEREGEFVYFKERFVFVAVYKNVGHAITLKTLMYFERMRDDDIF